MALRLPRLDQNTAYFTAEGRATYQMQVFWQRTVEAIEKAFEDVQAVNQQQSDTIAAIQAAQAAIAAANQAVTVAQAAADTANTAAGAANEAVAGLSSGDFDLSAVMIGGQRFVNNNGTLQVEP